LAANVENCSWQKSKLAKRRRDVTGGEICFQKIPQLGGVAGHGGFFWWKKLRKHTILLGCTFAVIYSRGLNGQIGECSRFWGFRRFAHAGQPWATVSGLCAILCGLSVPHLFPSDRDATETDDPYNKLFNVSGWKSNRDQTLESPDGLALRISKD
jgi:hypothetical protein